MKKYPGEKKEKRIAFFSLKLQSEVLFRSEEALKPQMSNGI